MGIILQVGINGHITFATSNPIVYTSAYFNNNNALIVPWYADVDARTIGNIYYRDAGSNTSLLRRAQNDVRRYISTQSSFKSNFLFIATWSNVTHYNRGSQVNITSRIKAVPVNLDIVTLNFKLFIVY